MSENGTDTKKDILFNRVDISVETLEGGAIVTSSLLDTSAKGAPWAVVSSERALCSGKGHILDARIRRAIKETTERVFPKKPKIGTLAADKTVDMFAAAK